MDNIELSYGVIFLLLILSIFFFLRLNPFHVKKGQKPVRKDSRLTKAEKIGLHFQTLFRQTGTNMKKFVLMIAGAMIAGLIGGHLLFNSTELALLTAFCLIPAPYFYQTIKSSRAAREEIEGLENTMSVITNAYAACNDVVRAIETYVHEKNRYIPAQLRRATPFDEFVSEIQMVNPNVEHGLYRLSARIKNRYFAEWTKMLILCHRDRRLKFALFPIIQAMNDAKTMQVESDSMMVRVWKDYLMTVGMMFCVIPMMRYANKEWFAILTHTIIGKMLIVVMLLTALATSFYVLKVTKPANR